MDLGELINSSMSKRQRVSWNDDSSNESDEESTRRLLNNAHNINNYQSTEQDLKDHEEGLNKLGDTIRRQRNIADDLANEVDLQDEVIDGIDSGLTSVGDNLRKNTRNIKLISTKSGTFMLWLTIVGLGIIIVVLAII